MATTSKKTVRNVQLAVAAVAVVIMIIGVAIIMQPTEKQKALDQIHQETEQLQKQIADKSISPEDANKKADELLARMQQIEAMP